MRVVRALMMLFGALAVLMSGAMPASAIADASSPPPCHEATMQHGGEETPSPDPGKAMKAMDCCIACVMTAALRSPDRARLTPPRPSAVAPPTAMPQGERPAPEPHPPRPDSL